MVQLCVLPFPVCANERRSLYSRDTEGFFRQDWIIASQRRWACDTYLTFLWPSDEDTGPEVRVGFRFLGRPGPRLAGLRGVSSFLLANTDLNSEGKRDKVWDTKTYLNSK